MVALSHFAKPVTSAHTQDLIKKQKESRRERHIQAMNEFEMGTEALYKDIALN